MIIHPTQRSLVPRPDGRALSLLLEYFVPGGPKQGKRGVRPLGLSRPYTTSPRITQRQLLTLAQDAAVAQQSA